MLCLPCFRIAALTAVSLILVQPPVLASVDAVPGAQVLQQPDEEPFVFIGTTDDWFGALPQIEPMSPAEWSAYMGAWATPLEGPPYPPNEFLSPELPTGDLYVWPDGAAEEHPGAGLVMYWSVQDQPSGDYSAAWKYVLDPEPPAAKQPGAPVNLTNTIISVTVTAPQLDMNGNQINTVSFGVQDVFGSFRAWYWNVGPAPAPIQWWVPTTISINMGATGVSAATPTATSFMDNGFVITQSQQIIVDENATWVGGGTPIPPPGSPPGAAWNYWYNLSIAPGGGGGGPSAHGPTSFSVDGPNGNSLGYDGPPAPGMTYFPPPWLPPLPLNAGPLATLRIPAPNQAVGIATGRPGDVNDYFFFGVPSEAEIFQSEPDQGPASGPSGTNNQVLQAVAMGLPHGLANVNAYTFGEDFFNGDEVPFSDIPAVTDEPWDMRLGLGGFIEPIVGGAGQPIALYFSVDPWGIGLPGTSVQNEATLQGAMLLPPGPPGAADVGAGAGPWASDGEAAGDVFFAAPSIAFGLNFLDHDDVALALLAPRQAAPPGMIMEDDLDALEHMGTNAAGQPGNTHDRIAPTSGINGGFHPPDLGDPNNPNHDPVNAFPIVFSVDRGTWGAPGSAVDAQVNTPVEGASGDLFVAVTLSAGTFPGVTTNMLLIDEGQMGLMPHDDLDAVILQILIDSQDLQDRILTASDHFDPESPTGSVGYGFTSPLLGPGEAIVGFSVDAGSIGLVFTAVDFECRVDGSALIGPGFAGSGLMEQAGDVFYTDLLPPAGQPQTDPGTLLLYGQNYLWFEEIALGLDPGAWTFVTPPGPSGNLEDAPDELNALDSDEFIEEEIEACCVSDGTCIDDTPTTCTDIHGGTPQGAGTICSGVTIACCLPGGGCMDTDPLCCDELNGTPSPLGEPICLNDIDGDGNNDACVPPQLPQACCLPDGTCAMLRHNDCVNAGGDPQGPDTDCGSVVCNEIKWAQPPTFNNQSPHPECFWGWDEDSVYGWSQIVADDFLCQDERPITDIHWWGSYKDWEAVDPPQPAPELFHIGIWTDTPAGIDFPWSHPDVMIEEWIVPRAELNERPVACDFHPSFMVNPDGCFRYDFLIPPSLWFQQDGASAIYWISIAAVYPGGDPGPHPWGWKTREHFFNDDAIRILFPTDPSFGSEFLEGFPIEEPPGVSWDLAFVLTTEAPVDGCCFNDSTCMDVTPQECIDNGGSPQGQPCAGVMEACCLNDGFGTCVMVDPVCCDDIGGTPQGAGAACAATTIACCLPGGGCMDTDPLCCDELGGTPSPLGEPACLDDNDGDGNDDACVAPQLPQACCLPDGQCQNLTHNQCVGAGGDPQGPGTDCDTTECSPIKWAQPPTFNPASPHPECFWGWDEYSVFGAPEGMAGAPAWITADDWMCENELPVSDIHWWGSYIGWNMIEPPDGAPTAFHIGLWTNAAVFPFSHPDVMIREWIVPREILNERPVACDFHPDTMDVPDGCYRYDFDIPEPDWFFQEAACTVYWISIASMYTTRTCPCDGDVNGNGVVDLADVLVVNSCVGQPPVGPCAAADIDCDGDVDSHDVQVLNCQLQMLFPPEQCCWAPGEFPWGWKTREHFFEDDAVRIFIPNNPEPGQSYQFGEPIEDFTGATWDTAFVITTRGCPIAEKPQAEVYVAPCTTDLDCLNESVCRDGSCYVPKNKYLSFLPGNTDRSVALRVTMVSNDLYPGLVGSSWWVQPHDVGDPPFLYRLGCGPHFQDWSSEPPVLQVSDVHVTPEGVYRIEAIALGCDPGDPSSYSPPLDLPTPQNWADCLGVFDGSLWTPPDGFVNLGDALAGVLVTEGDPGAPDIAWVDLDLDPVNGLVNLGDVLRVVIAIEVGAYPYGGPVPCP